MNLLPSRNLAAAFICFSNKDSLSKLNKLGAISPGFPPLGSQRQLTLAGERPPGWECAGNSPAVSCGPGQLAPCCQKKPKQCSGVHGTGVTHSHGTPSGCRIANALSSTAPEYRLHPVRPFGHVSTSTVHPRLRLSPASLSLPAPVSLLFHSIKLLLAQGSQPLLLLLPQEASAPYSETPIPENPSHLPPSWEPFHGEREQAGLGGGNNRRRQKAACSDIIATGLGMFGGVSSESMEQMTRVIESSDCDRKRTIEKFKSLVVESDSEEERENIGPLHDAASKGQMDTCKHLVEHLGFDVDSVAANGSGLTPLACAVSNGKPNIWAHISTLAAVICATPEKVSEFACLKCVKLLVKADADINSVNPDTPLVIATSKGLTEVVTYLLEVGADANIPIKHDKASLEDRKAQLKSLGGKAVAGMDYAGASKFYTEAIELDPADGTLYSNRSLCQLKIGEARDALRDANECTRLRPEWPKGYYRKGAALMSLKEYKEACDAFMDGLKLDPSNMDLQDAYWEASEAMSKHSAGQSASSLD
ncbi:hypothetical protein EJB05_55930, partial [Eragrostis curvula]